MDKFRKRAKKHAKTAGGDFEQATAWKPEPDEELIGWLDGIEKDIPGQNGPWTAVRIRDEAGELWSVGATKMIRDELVDGGDDLDGPPARWSLVYLRFEETVKLRSGRQFKKFAVFYAEPDDDDWEEPEWLDESELGQPCPVRDVGAEMEGYDADEDDDEPRPKPKKKGGKGKKSKGGKKKKSGKKKDDYPF